MVHCSITILLDSVCYQVIFCLAFKNEIGLWFLTFLLILTGVGVLENIPFKILFILPYVGIGLSFENGFIQNGKICH